MSDAIPSPPGPVSDHPPGAPTGGPPGSPPRLDDRERGLAARIVTVWRLGSAVSLLLPALVLTTLAFVLLDDWGWVVLAGMLVLGLLMVVWYQPARFRRWRWQLTDVALELRYGMLVHRQETVPYFRIQQIDIVQGPLDRLLDLASLQVTTASASGSASLPGIERSEAPLVRAELLARAAAAVAEHPGDLRDAV